MTQNDHLLKIVTNETKKSIEQLDIVVPSVFNSIFSKFAKNHNLPLDNEEKIAQDLIERECNALTHLQSETSKNALRLSDSTSKAISAIKEKDDTLLNKVLQETQELKKEIEKLKESIYKDMLTNTLNRKWLHDNYMKDGSVLSSNGGTLALIDLNYFKEINDTYGHVIGDKVLIFLAGEFLKLKYPVIRYGGDEFIIMFPQIISQDKALKILEDLRESILHKKMKAHNKTFTVSFSFGLKGFDANEPCSDILDAADRNMYKDKIEIKKRITSI